MVTAKINSDLETSYKQTSLGWQSQYLKIVDKRSRLVPLVHNRAQHKVNNVASLQIKHNLPVMLLILKARQRGISTFIEACIFEKINRQQNVHANVISKDKISTDKVFRMCEIYQTEMPEEAKRPTDRSSSKEIRYAAPHRSSLLCQTAGSKDLGRGGTTRYQHLTEVAFWRNARTQLTGLLQEVPKNDPDTMVVEETTANGVGGAFYDDYWAAVARLRRDPHDYAGYLPIFLSWQDEPEYQTPLPDGCDSVPNMTPEMEEYVKEGLAMGVSLVPEQIYFALLTIQNTCGGDISRFKAEYPRNAHEAFQSTGRGVFNPLDLDIMEHACRPPAATVEFYREGKKVKYRHVNRRENCWSVWQWPKKNHSYVGFGDPAEGALCDPNDPKSEPDRSVWAMMDRVEHDLPITYYGRPDTIEFGDQTLMACEYYNYPWASPEMNSIGQSCLDTFKRGEYPYIYQRERKEDEIEREDSLKLGWRTTALTRKPMIADLQEVVKNHGLTIYDIRFIEEMRVFVWSSQGKPCAEVGEHDDTVMTTAGCVQLHQRCPLNEDLGPVDSAKQEDKPAAIMAEVDSGVDEDEGPDEDLYEDISQVE